MKMRKIKFLFIGVMAASVITLLPTKVHATYQSKPNATSATASVSNFFLNIRKMEENGQVMGKTETINQDNGTATSTSNNLDVHMMKNTEYGGAAMLSASIYGLAPIGISDASTTGNNFGVFQLSNNNDEYVAAINSTQYYNGYFTQVLAAQTKYKNIYTDGNASDWSRYIPGDATYETLNWFYNNSNTSLIDYYRSTFLRNYGGMFSFVSCYGNEARRSRGVAICGEGI